MRVNVLYHQQGQISSFVVIISKSLPLTCFIAKLLHTKIKSSFQRTGQSTCCSFATRTCYAGL